MDDINAVLIAVPHMLHVEIAVAAAEAGKHIYLEKPMANSVDECDRIIHSVNKAGVKLLIGSNRRFDQYNVLLRKLLIEDEIIGTIITATHAKGFDLRRVMREGRMSSKQKTDIPVAGERDGQKWRFDSQMAGGGIMFDLGWHCTDLLRWLIPKDIKRVSAMTGLLGLKEILPPSVEDTGVIMYEFENGAIATVHTSFTISVPYNVDEPLTIWGTKGRIRSWAAGPEPLPEKPLEIWVDGEPNKYPGEVYPKISFDPWEPYYDLVDHFADCILEDKTPRITGEDGKKTIECLLAAYKSAESGKVINLPLNK